MSLPHPSLPRPAPGRTPALAPLLALLLAACTVPPEPGTDGGTLPDGGPGQVDERPEDAHAAALATRLAPGGVETQAALEEALASAGIAVRSLADGSLLTPPQPPSQGLALAEHDPEVLAALQASGARASLTDVAAVLAGVLPGTDAAQLADAMLEDLRTAARSDVATTRAWARLILELGRHGPEPYELLGEVTPEQVQLDSVQRTLLVLRLAGDLAAYAQRHGAAPGTQRQGLRPAGAAPAAHCTFTGVEGTIMDIAATALTTGFGHLLDVLDAADISGADKASVALSAANIVLAYAKLAFSMAVFRFDMRLDTDRVIRTQSLYENGQGPYRAEGNLSFDFSRGIQYLNCLRLALNAMGADASVPNAGKVEGANVRWKLNGVEGPTGPDRFLDILEYLPGEEVLHDKSDAAGNVEVWFQGRKQRREVGSSPLPVTKPGRVTGITEIKSASLAGDLVDAVGTALGLASAGITIIPELFNRMFPLAGFEDFPITDWEPSTRSTFGYAYIDREWAHADQVASGSYSATPLFDPSRATIPLGEDTHVEFEYRVEGSGTYVGARDEGGEQDWCTFAWSGSWTASLFITDARREADGSVSMEVRVSAAEEGDEAVSIDPECAPLGYGGLPWQYAVDVFNDDRTQRLVLPRGVEEIAVRMVNDVDGSELYVPLNFTGMLPQP